MNRHRDVLYVCSSYHRNTPREARMAVIKRVAKAHDVTVADIMGRRRIKYVVEARQAAMRAVASEFASDSLPMIGRLFNRDHTTILHALNKPVQKALQK